MYALVNKSLLLPLCGKYHLAQTTHDNSLVLSYGGQGRDPHLLSTKKNNKPSLLADDPVTDLNAVSTQVN